MRNLKKILALVLALVMSLSLMATASATDFKDDDQFNPTYKVAAQVLEGLGVLRGDPDGSFRPTGDITRAEAAAAVYRIVTGDVEDKQVGIYEDYQIFSDVNPGDWYAGYVNFCANAEYIKGNGDGTFSPNEKVNGYAVLAMILRAIGYTANGGFTGDDWHIQTARTAEARRITKNVLTGTLGEEAARETVAELLFQAILVNMVGHNVLNTENGNQGYYELNETLGQQVFGLEQIEGVVVANQWANLEEGRKVLSVGQTKMEVTDVPAAGATSAEGDVITLDYATDLDAVGLTHVAYIANKSGVKKVLTIEPTGNTIADNEGYAVNTNNSDEKYEDVDDLADSKGLSINKTTTKFYKNYDEDWGNSATHKILIRYTVDAGHLDGDGNYVQDVQSWVINWLNWVVDNSVSGNSATRVGTASEPISYTRTISPRYDVEANDIDIMQGIFYTADRQGINDDDEVKNYLTGEVYVGTSSLEDVSDKIDWDEFCETYLEFQMDYQYLNAENGEWLRVIDNDGNGVADYVFKVEYTLDEVIGTYKNALLLNNEAFKDYSAANNTLVAPEDLEQGDVVVFSKIDGQLHVRLAETDDAVIDTKNFKNITVTTETPDTYGQSGIENATSMDQDILNMNQKTEYIMYKDLFGFVRAYKLAQGSKYALITEMYPGARNNGNYIKDTWATAEVKIGNADVTNYNVNGGTDNAFFNGYVWTEGGYYNDQNYLQPAVAHLDNYINFTGYAYNPGKTTSALAAPYSYAGISWDRDAKAADTPYGVFMTDTTTPDAKSFTFTNVAVYSQLTEETVSLDTASKLLKDKNGHQLYYWIGGALTIGSTTYQNYELKVTAEDWNSSDMGGKSFTAAWTNGDLAPVYKTDYVQLVPQDVEAKTIHYTIDPNYQNNYKSIANTYVDATVDTEFYIVTPDDIFYFEGYDELPTIDADKVRATYAVATNTADDWQDKDYWIADVIVIEVSELDSSVESISLMYYNPWETTGSTRYVNSLNNKWRTYQPDSELFAMIDVVPSKTVATGAPVGWGDAPWTNVANIANTGYGFYKLYKTEADGEGTVKAAKAEKILAADDYKDYGIYAGEVTRVEGLQKSGYIDVTTTNTGSGRTHAIWVGYTGDDVPIYRISQQYNNRVITAVELELNNNEERSDVKVNDKLIWVYEKSNGKLAFIVDVTASTQRSNNPSYWAPAWLTGGTGLYQEILDDMDPTPGYKTIDFNVHLGAGDSITITAGDNDPISVPETGVAPAGGETYPVSIQVSGTAKFVSLVIEGLTGADVVNIRNLGSDWVVEKAPAWNATDSTWELSVKDPAVQIASLDVDVTDTGVDVAIYTEKAVQAIADLWENAADETEKARLAEILTDLADTTLEIDGVPVSDTAKDAADDIIADAAAEEMATLWAALATTDTPTETEKVELYAAAAAYIGADGDPTDVTYVKILAKANADTNEVKTAMASFGTSVESWKTAGEALNKVKASGANNVATTNKLTNTEITSVEKHADAFAKAQALVNSAKTATVSNKGTYVEDLAAFKAAVVAAGKTVAAVIEYTDAKTGTLFDTSKTLKAAVEDEATIDPKPATITVTLKNNVKATLVEDTDGGNDYILIVDDASNYAAIDGDFKGEQLKAFVEISGTNCNPTVADNATHTAGVFTITASGTAGANPDDVKILVRVPNDAEKNDKAVKADAAALATTLEDGIKLRLVACDEDAVQEALDAKITALIGALTNESTAKADTLSAPVIADYTPPAGIDLSVSFSTTVKVTLTKGTGADTKTADVEVPVTVKVTKLAQAEG